MRPWSNVYIDAIVVMVVLYKLALDSITRFICKQFKFKSFHFDHFNLKTASIGLDSYINDQRISKFDELTLQLK